MSEAQIPGTEPSELPSSIRVFDVTKFGARGDDTTDDSDAIIEAIKCIPPKQDDWGPSGNRVDHGYTLYLPTPPRAYLVKKQ